jgi:hypothetical protein
LATEPNLFIGVSLRNFRHVIILCTCILVLNRTSFGKPCIYFIITNTHSISFRHGYFDTSYMKCITKGTLVLQQNRNPVHPENYRSTRCTTSLRSYNLWQHLPSLWSYQPTKLQHTDYLENLKIWKCAAQLVDPGFWVVVWQLHAISLFCESVAAGLNPPWARWTPHALVIWGAFNYARSLCTRRLFCADIYQERQHIHTSTIKCTPGQWQTDWQVVTTGKGPQSSYKHRPVVKLMWDLIFRVGQPLCLYT